MNEDNSQCEFIRDDNICKILEKQCISQENCKDLCLMCRNFKTMFVTLDNIKNHSFFDNYTLHKKLKTIEPCPHCGKPYLKIWWCSKNTGKTREMYITKQYIMGLRKSEC